MDPQQNSLKQLQDLLSHAQEILITTKDQPSIDGICACLALYNALSNKRDLQGKQKKVVLAVSGRQGSQYSALPGSDKIVSELGLRDLVIGVNGFVENSIENVNWYVEKGRLNVVFKSNPAVPMQFDLKNLDPFYAGANFDVVIVLDAVQPSDLGNAYKQDPGMYSELPVINISNKPSNTKFGRVNIVDAQVPAVSELVYQLLQILQTPVTGEVAGLLLLGIQDGTQEMQNKGPQTDVIVNQLNGASPAQLNLQAVRAQTSQPPLPVQGAQSMPVNNAFPQTNGFNPQYPMGMPPGYAYPQQGQPNPYFPPGYPNQYQPAPGVASNPYSQAPGGYNPYQTPGTFPQNPPVPGYQPQNPYIQQTAPWTAGYQGQPGYAPNTDPNQGYPNTQEAVPSVQHDQLQHEPYVPTTSQPSFDHVEPSVHMPNLNPQYPNYYQPGTSDPSAAAQQPQKPEEGKVDAPAPDWMKPPAVFKGGGEGR